MVQVQTSFSTPECFYNKPNDWTLTVESHQIPCRGESSTQMSTISNQIWPCFYFYIICSVYNLISIIEFMC